MLIKRIQLGISLLAISAAVWLVLVAGARPAFAYQNSIYWNNAALGGHQSKSSGFNYWKTNKAWRPLGCCGYWGAVWFANNQTIQAGYVQSLNSNPIVTQGAYGYDWGTCMNLENFTVSPYTCEVFNWYA